MRRTVTTPRLVWKDNDFSQCGRFVIQTERARGEGTWYELWIYDTACRWKAVEMGVDLGCYGDKRKIRRLAQRIADAVEADR